MRPVYFKVQVLMRERNSTRNLVVKITVTVKITTATELSNPVVQNDTDNLNNSYKLCE